MNRQIVKRHSQRWRRVATTTAGALALLVATPSMAQSGGLCGRTGDVSQLLLELQKPAAERLWRDNKLFVLRDHDDGTMWAFSIKNSTVHPAVRCRRPLPGGAGPGFQVGQLCAAGEAACASFAEQVDEKFAAAVPASAAPERAPPR